MGRTTAIQRLETGWLLVHDPLNRGREEQWFRGIPEAAAVSAAVPGFVHQFLPDCPGIAWYQVRFTTILREDASHIVSLHFGMADFLCEAYLNGVLIGTHRGGENPFSFDAGGALQPEAENLLCVRLSKPHTEAVDGYSFWEIPHRNQRPEGLMPGCCYNLYGLGGAVTLSRQPRLRLADVYLHGNVETGCIEAVCTVSSSLAAPCDATLSLLAGEALSGLAEAETSLAFTALPGEGVYTLSLPLPRVRLWDLDDPVLYFVITELRGGTSAHSLVKRCGFRTFGVSDEGWFVLNGRRLFLRCAHTGNCMPESTQHLSRDKALIRKDFAMAKAAGFNMVRFISGCALPEQLDLCDELGLMVYEEPTASWLMQDGPRARELYLYDLLTLVRRDRSHVCLTIWGLLNETPSTPPFGDCALIAQQALQPLRELDRTRLVLYSSGRFDGFADVGSVSNPLSNRWECLWDAEDPSQQGVVRRHPDDPDGFFHRVGDKHAYPRLPQSKAHTALLRTLGASAGRPVFLSEYGIGSLFDVLWLQKKFEQSRADPRMPDVRMVKRMADQFLSDLRAHGLEDAYPFPEDILQESYRFHARHRKASFDIVRSNPYLCGVSLTGLLDHSICGEGLWTLMREWKPGIADVLQDGFAPLRWCLFVSETHVFSGQPLGIEGVLANEDVLRPGDYPIRVRIFGEEGPVWEQAFTLQVREPDLRLLSLPVFRFDLSLALPEGSYLLRAEILGGAAASGGTLAFFVSDSARNRPAIPGVAGIGLTRDTLSFLEEQGIRVSKLDEGAQATVVLVGDLDEAEKEGAWALVNSALASGCHVLVASRFALMKDGQTAHYFPLPNKPDNLPGHRERTDWLYHKEYLAKPGHPYFKGLQSGLMDWDYYGPLINGAFFRHKDAKEAFEVAAACFGTGMVKPDGYEGGMNLAACQVGKGVLILNSFSVLENLRVSPAAGRLLVNILTTEYARLHARPDGAGQNAGPGRAAHRKAGKASWART